MITIKGYEIKHNPFLKQHFNLTHQIVLYQQNREMYDRLKAQAEPLNREFEAKDKARKFEELKNKLERENAVRRRKRKIERAKAGVSISE